MTIQPATYQPVQFNGAGSFAAPAVQGLSFIWHGLAKAGKSNLADSGPKPRILVDVEGQGRWTASRKVIWDPLRQTPPVPDRRVTAGYGPVSITPAWETALVIARDAQIIEAVYNVLNTGRHPFNSASVDSVTEMQQRIIDALVGRRAMKQENWGALLREVSWYTRKWRDLIVHPVKPLWSVSFTAGTHIDNRTGRWRPLVQGSSQDFLPYYVDVLGYIWAEPSGQRWALIGPDKTYETGERIGGRLPATMPIAYPGRAQGWNAETMVRQAITGG